MYVTVLANLPTWMKTCHGGLHKLQVICSPGQGHIQTERQPDLQPAKKKIIISIKFNEIKYIG